MIYRQVRLEDYEKLNPISNCFIYRIIDSFHNLSYIGKSTTGFRRFYQHLSNLLNQIHHNKFLQNCFNKYPEYFYVEIIDYPPLDEIDDYEIEYIKLFDCKNNGFNFTDGGEGNSKYIELYGFVEDIIKQYNNGLSSVKLAKQYNCSHATILRLLKMNNVEIKGVSFFNQSIARLHVDDICEKYLDGFNCNELGELYNCDHHTISTILNENSIPRRSLSSIRKSDVWSYGIDVCMNYLLGKSTRELGKMYNSNSSTISAILKHYNCPSRPRSVKSHKAWRFVDEIKEKRNKGYTLQQLAKEYGCGRTLISRIIDEG